jgi:hypothetical protein
MLEVLGLNISWVTGYPDRTFVDFLIFSRQMPGYYFQTGHDHLNPNPYLFTVHDHLPISFDAAEPL